MPLTLVTPPAGEPITLADARLHLRLDATGSPPTHPDDALVTSLITAARQHLDGPSGILGRALMTQTWRLDLPAFPASDAAITLPLPPLQSVTSIVYPDSDGSPVTLSPTLYEVAQGPWGQGLVRPVFGESWPLARHEPDAVRITFVAGYGNAAAVPAPLVAAMKLHLGVLYENREAASQKPLSVVPLAYDALITPYRLVWV
jgi:uncharacterized phiE125 gp8 family phage protein